MSITIEALKKAIEINPKLKAQAEGDQDLAEISEDDRYKELVKWFFKKNRKK